MITNIILLLILCMLVNKGMKWWYAIIAYAVIHTSVSVFKGAGLITALDAMLLYILVPTLAFFIVHKTQESVSLWWISAVTAAVLMDLQALALSSI